MKVGKFLEWVVATTTLGDTLQEPQLLCLGLTLTSRSSLLEFCLILLITLASLLSLVGDAIPSIPLVDLTHFIRLVKIQWF